MKKSDGNEEQKKRLLAAQRKIHLRQKVYGTTLVGARGQIVIPAEARKDLSISAGNQLLIIGNGAGMLGIMKSDDLGKFIKMLSKHLEGTGLEKTAIKHFDQLIKKLRKK